MRTAAARLHVVLVSPQIAHNTGAAGRTCIGFGASLHLVGPLGFSLSDSRVKRAGLDYWPHVAKTVYSDWDEFEERALPGFARTFLFSKESK
jgi:tRNA (cytidine/uridine-2'-O-)-methyltransferase